MRWPSPQRSWLRAETVRGGMRPGALALDRRRAFRGQHQTMFHVKRDSGAPRPTGDLYMPDQGGPRPSPAHGGRTAASHTGGRYGPGTPGTGAAEHRGEVLPSRTGGRTGRVAPVEGLAESHRWKDWPSRTGRRTGRAAPVGHSRASRPAGPPRAPRLSWWPPGLLRHRPLQGPQRRRARVLPTQAVARTGDPLRQGRRHLARRRRPRRHRHLAALRTERKAHKHLSDML